MERVERVRAQRQVLASLERSRERVAVVAGARQRGRDQLAQLLRRDLLARVVHGREVGSRRPVSAEVVGLDGEAAAAKGPAQTDARPRL